MSGLVARWPFDGDLRDAGGRFDGEAVDAQGQPSPVPFAEGMAAQALDQRSGDRLVRVMPDTLLTPQNLSLVFWANSPLTDSGFPEVLVGKGRDCLANYGCSIRPEGLLRCDLNDGRGWCEDSLTVSTPWPSLKWTHVVFTVEQDLAAPQVRLALFLDGVLLDEHTAADAHVVNNPEWYLLFGGHHQEPGDVGVTPYFSHALLDELQLYDRALTAKEVEAAYAASAR